MYYRLTVKKFPVTAPDGTQYQVKIKEGADIFDRRYARVSLYEKRRYFGFREVSSKRYEDGGVYSADSPDFIAIATKVLEDYTRDIEHFEQVRIADQDELTRKEKAWQQFDQWDGNV